MTPGEDELPAAKPGGGRRVEPERASADASAADEATAASENPNAENPDAAAEDADAERGVNAANANAANPDARVHRQAAVRTRRSFLVAGAAAAGAYGLYRAIGRAPQQGHQPASLRKAFAVNAALSRTVFQEHALAPTYAVGQSVPLRLNGNFGLRQELQPGSWRLQLAGVAGAEQHPQYSEDLTKWQYAYVPLAMDDVHTSMDASDPSNSPDAQAPRKRGSEEAGESASELRPGTPGLLLTMADVRALPHVELVTQFKCIEGWSQIVHWGGVRLADLIALYPPAPVDGRLPRYVYMETPDGDYYCGFDMAACLHPQSLLVYEMAGRPLENLHGAPLRLHMPIKYGYKQIKRIGLIAYTDLHPDDYWTKLGYDWYAGL